MFFSIELHSRDANILKQIKAYFNNIHSTISINEKGKSIKLEINSIKDLVVLIKYFEKYSLITQKRVDCVLWKKAFKLMEGREHLTYDRLLKILGIKASMNLGLYDTLKKAIPSVIPGG